uniref:Uncharacterized protein n=1 Tax=Anguilla anguilla TaxID=7936 RepID=A0A0E9X9T9_ANGAN
MKLASELYRKKHSLLAAFKHSA